MGGAFLVAGPVGFVATKTVLGTTGRYIGGQAALERYTKVLGDKSGLIIDIRKEIARKAKTGSAIFNSLDTYIASIPPDKIRQEAARLRMLQVEKGVSLDRLAISGDDGNIVALIMQRNNELIAQEAVKNARLNNNPALAVPDALSNSLALQINSMHEMGEKEIDKNRRKKMVRNFLAASALRNRIFFSYSRRRGYGRTWGRIFVSCARRRMERRGGQFWRSGCDGTLGHLFSRLRFGQNWFRNFRDFRPYPAPSSSFR